jgi:hypothetical protein
LALKEASNRIGTVRESSFPARFRYEEKSSPTTENGDGDGETIPGAGLGGIPG